MLYRIDFRPHTCLQVPKSEEKIVLSLSLILEARIEGFIT